MKTRFLSFLITLSLFSCVEREVQLPETTIAEVTDVKDVSPIYIFYDESTGQAEFNRNNMIGTTNWLVNADKRLSLSEVVPHLITLQEKRRKDGLHTNEAAKNYFSCSNPEIMNLSFLDFTNITYHLEPIAEFMQKSTEPTEYITRVFVNFQDDDLVEIGRQFAVTKTDRDKFVQVLKGFSSKDENTNLVFLNFSEQLSLQDYISIKSDLFGKEDSKMIIARDEFIYK